jgi:hypothetical protein
MVSYFWFINHFFRWFLVVPPKDGFALTFLKPYDNNTFFFNNISKQHVIFYCHQHACVFFLLNNSSDNKWFDFRFHLEVFAPSYLFYHALRQNILSLLCPNLSCFGLGAGV